MKTLLFRLWVLVGGGLLLALGLFLFEAGQADLASAYAPPNSGEAAPDRTFHEWDINEIFSFLSNSGTPTMGRSLLLATSGFAGLPGGITPDFIIPNNFLFTGGGLVDFAGVDALDYTAGELPLDGVNSLSGSNTTSTNSPTNFAGQTGSVTGPLSVTKQAQSSTIQPDDLITYTLTVVSMGTLTNTNTVLTDTIPASTTFVVAATGITPTNGVLTWTLGDLLPPSTVVTRTFVVSANASAGQTIVNAEYGVQSDQASATGLALETTVTMGLNVYLPIILKNFDPVSEHAADLPIQPLWR
jgi:uncharacterized repeat protein (TIGR01451 family)